MKIIKKNQLTILVLALMLVTAGYLNYNANNSVKTSTDVASIGDATFVSSNAIFENVSSNDLVETTNDNNSDIKENNSIAENTVNTNSEVNKNNKEDYYTSSKLEREKMYSQMLESYQKILDSTTTSNKQKEAAQKEIKTINNTKNAIMISENLISTKGFDDCVVYENDGSINAVIKKEKLTKEDIAQIQSILAREMNVKIENIHIMTK